MDPSFESHFQQMLYDPYYEPISAYQIQGALYFIEHQGGVKYSDDGWEVTGKIQRVQYETWVSPIVIDLNNDGLDFIALDESKATFDFGSDGNQVRTAWLGSSDGFLVVDKNGNNRIDNLLEMFGGRAAGQAYEQLEVYDTDGSGLLNKQDEAFNKLAIWRDANGNGVSEDGELSSLAENGISELSLSVTKIGQKQGDIFLSEGSIAKVNGIDISMVDVFLRTSGLVMSVQAENSYHMIERDVYYNTLLSEL